MIGRRHQGAAKPVPVHPAWSPLLAADVVPARAIERVPEVPAPRSWEPAPIPPPPVPPPPPTAVPAFPPPSVARPVPRLVPDRRSVVQLRFRDESVLDLGPDDPLARALQTVADALVRPRDAF
jgi:hypothetical protein